MQARPLVRRGVMMVELAIKVLLVAYVVYAVLGAPMLSAPRRQV